MSVPTKNIIHVPKRMLSRQINALRGAGFAMLTRLSSLSEIENGITMASPRWDMFYPQPLCHLNTGRRLRAGNWLDKPKMSANLPQWQKQKRSLQYGAFLQCILIDLGFYKHYLTWKKTFLPIHHHVCNTHICMCSHTHTHVNTQIHT